MSYWKQYTVAQKNGSKCSWCSQPIDKGTHIVEWAHGSSAWPKLHKTCLAEMHNTLASKEDALNKEYKEAEEKATIREEAHKEALKKTHETRAWKKQIVKSALQEIGICVSKVSFTNPNDWGTSGEGDLIKFAKKNRQQWAQHPFCWFRIDKTRVDVFSPENRQGLVRPTFDWWVQDVYAAYPKHETIELADPEALKKIGAAVERLHDGDLSPYRTKKWKKDNQ